MKSALIASVIGVFLLLLSTAAYADPPPGVGAAVTDSGFECSVGVVSRPGEAFPIFSGGYGYVLAPIVGENTKFVRTFSANGNINLSCHGRALEGGTEITTIDLFTLLPVTVTIADFDEACDALSAEFPDVCRGGVAISNAETSYHPIFNPTGGTCEVLPGVLTSDYRVILTRSGRVGLTCQYVEGTPIPTPPPGPTPTPGGPTPTPGP